MFFQTSTCTYTCIIICTYITYTCIVHISTYIQSLLINIYTLLVAFSINATSKAYHNCWQSAISFCKVHVHVYSSLGEPIGVYSCVRACVR